MQPIMPELNLVSALSHLVLIVLVRALPYVVYLSTARAQPWTLRLTVVASYAGLLAASNLHNRMVLLWFAVGCAYYLVTVCVLHWATASRRAVSVSERITLFGVVFALHLVVPALAFPTKVASVFLFVGWELMLKGYSFGVESSARGLGLRQTLFFFLVDPTLVFTQRAQAVHRPGIATAASLRLALGAGALLLPALLAKPATAWVSQHLESSGRGWAEAGVLALGAVELLSEYAKHSGVASLQIALMRFCGYRLGERYHYPLLARSPADFWSRWNIYVGYWLKRYIYYPLVRSLSRSRHMLARRGAPAAGVCVAFVVVGAMHDTFDMLSSRTLSWAWTTFFVANACLLLAAAYAGSLPKLQWQRGAVARSAYGALFLLLIGLWTK